MITPYTLGNTTWLDIHEPTREEVTALIERFGISAQSAEDLLAPTPGNQVHKTKNSVHLTLHFPALRHSHRTSMQQEIDMLILEHTVITCRYDSVDALDSLAKQAETLAATTESPLPNGVAVAAWILSKLYHSLGHEIGALEDSLQELEGPMFTSREHYVVQQLSRLSRQLITCRKTLATHTLVLKDVFEYVITVFGPSHHRVLNDVRAQHDKLFNRLTAVHELLLEIRNTNDSLLSLRQSSTMQSLTFITMLVGTLLALYDLLTLQTLGDFIPGTEHDMVVAIGIYLFFIGGMIVWARTRRWI